MNQSESTVPPSMTPQVSKGLAITSLVLGILAIVLSLFLLGFILGIIGVIAGALYLRRRPPEKGMARWGVGLSILGLLMSIGFGVLYYKAYENYKDLMAGFSSYEETVPITEWEGVVAPDFTVTTLEGQSVQLSSLRGKRVIVDMWATWCPPCVKEIPHFIQLAKEIPQDQLVIVGISDEDSQTLKSFVQKMGINYAIASEEEMPSPYGDVTSIPTTFFIDRNGVIQTILVGYHDYNELRKNAVAEDFTGSPKEAPTMPREEIEEGDQPIAAK